MNSPIENTQNGYNAYEDILNNNLKDLPESLKQSEEYDPKEIIKSDEWKSEQPIKVLTPQQEAKLERYDKLDLGSPLITDNWKSELQTLKDNQEKHQPTDLKPDNLPTNWETELARIPILEQRPDIAITKNDWDTDWSKRPSLTDHNKVQTDLKDWTDVFGTKTPTDVQNDLKAGKVLTPKEEEAIREYDNVKDRPTKAQLDQAVLDAKPADYEDLKKWPAKFVDETLDSAFAKYSEPKEQHTDYDAIKAVKESWTSVFPSSNTKPADVLIRYNAYATVKTERDDWLASFPNVDFKDKGITPTQIRTKYDEPKGTTLTPDQQEAINNYQKVKGDLKPWTDAFGAETAQQIKTKLDAKITPTEQGKINDYDKVKGDLNLWTKTFPAPNTPSSVKIQVDRFFMIMKLERQKLQELNRIKP